MTYLALAPLLLVAFFAGKRVGMAKARRLCEMVRAAQEANT